VSGLEWLSEANTVSCTGDLKERKKKDGWLEVGLFGFHEGIFEARGSGQG